MQLDFFYHNRTPSYASMSTISGQVQFGVACPMGSEKVIHGIRACVDKHWNDLEFSVLKVDFKNAFNLVSRDAVLQECA